MCNVIFSNIVFLVVLMAGIGLVGCTLYFICAVRRLFVCVQIIVRALEEKHGTHIRSYGYSYFEHEGQISKTLFKEKHELRARLFALEQKKGKGK